MHDRPFRLEFIRVNPDLIAYSFTANEDDVRALKWRLLGKLGIAQENAAQSPWDAFLTHLARINDLPDTRPVHPQIGRALTEDPDASRFTFFLA